MKTILVPTDFSKNALNAVKYAFAFAQKTESTICLFHSFDSPTGELNIPFTNTHIGKMEGRQSAEQQMNKLATSLSKIFPEIKPQCIVESGLATDTIIHYIKKHKISIVILGTTGEGAIERSLFGSTTSGIINDAACTVIAVPPKAKFKGIYKVTVATDLEKHSLKAFSDSVVFAKQLNAEIEFVYIEDLNIFDATGILQKLVNEIKKNIGYDKVSFHVKVNSSIIEGLEEFVKKEKPDLLSMITHSRKFPETIWKRSITNIMSNHTSIPLVVFHSH